MYLAGQLPYGPPSTNVGGQLNFDGDSPLFGDSVGDPPPAVDPSGGAANTQNTYVVPGGGQQVVNPSIATANGIVQPPITSPASRTRFQKLPAGARDSCGSGLSGFGAVDPATCLEIQCGTLSQEAAGMSLIVECADAGYAGVKSCVDPACSCPAPPAPQSVTRAAPPSSVPGPPAGYVPPSIETPCGGYAASSVLPMLQNNAGRGMGDCCQSGYQQFQSNQVGGDSSNAFLWLAAGVILLMLTPSGGSK
jgi:hypothetical protein